MAKETKPTGKGGVNALAATELSGDRTRSGPRVTGRSLEARQVGRFRLDAQLGSGGMGDVFRAYDPVLDRAVALKVLRTEPTSDDSQRMRRVVREARAAAALTHPNTVTIFEVGEADGEVFIAMELLEGEDLRAVIERGSASQGDKLRWLLQAARALAVAHERGLVHRDVKPENMFVCKDGALKLLDFGIAKRDEDDGAGAPAGEIGGPSSLRTQEGRRFGTPRYMAPEQLAGDATDPRTDQYAWGLVAFELLTGTDVVASMVTVTREGGAVATLPAHVAGAESAALLRAKVPELPEAIVLAVVRALEPRQEDRFPSMSPIVAALDLPSDSARFDPPKDTPRRRKRYRIAACVVALAAVGGVFTARRATRAGSVAPGLAKVAPPACRVESTQVVEVGSDDRVAIRPDGAVVVARDIRRGIFLERETPEGAVPILRTPLTAALAGIYKDVELTGLTYEGSPAISLTFEVGDFKDALFTAWTENSATGAHRIPGPYSGFVATPWGKDVLALVTTPLLPARVTSELKSGVEIWRLRSGGAARPVLIEQGSASEPAIATSDDFIAVAYDFYGRIHFALLDKDLLPIGDVLTVAPTDAAPAISVDGATARVFWAELRGGKTRLFVSSFTRGGTTMTSPTEAIDDPLSPKRPVTARLPGGAWAVAWVSATGPATLRVSPVGKGGVLTGPTDVATGSTINGLKATSTARGIDFWWQETPTAIRIARVACTPP